MAWCCAAPTPVLTNIEQEKSADAPPPQEMSTNLLVSTGSNVPSPGGQVSWSCIDVRLTAATAAATCLVSAGAG